MNIRDYYNSVTESEYDVKILLEIIELLIVKKALTWEDPQEKLTQILSPPENLREAYNERLKQGLKEMG